MKGAEFNFSRNGQNYLVTCHEGSIVAIDSKPSVVLEMKNAGDSAQLFLDKFINELKRVTK